MVVEVVEHSVGLLMNSEESRARQEEIIAINVMGSLYGHNFHSGFIAIHCMLLRVTHDMHMDDVILKKKRQFIASQLEPGDERGKWPPVLTLTNTILSSEQWTGETQY